MARGIPALSRLEMLTRAARLLIMSAYSRRVALAMFYSVWMILMAGGCITPEISSEGSDLIAVPDGSFGGPDAFCDTTNCASAANRHPEPRPRECSGIDDPRELFTRWD
jgi:hypothetical protein